VSDLRKKLTGTTSQRNVLFERCKLIDFGRWADEEYRVPLENNHSIENIDLPDAPAHSSDDGFARN
jgi:hypothetical protein